MAGKIVADTLEHSTAGSIATNYVVEGSAKAWANLNGSTFGLRDSFNISSATDSGTGLYDHSFSSAMSNGNYSPSTNGHRDTNQSIGVRNSENTTSSYRVQTNGHTNTTKTDTDSAFSQIFGDLA